MDLLDQLQIIIIISLHTCTLLEIQLLTRVSQWYIKLY